MATKRVTKEQYKAQWMLDFSSIVTESLPHMAGEIDWHTAHHYFFQHVTARIAAEQYIKTHTYTTSKG